MTQSRGINAPRYRWTKASTEMLRRRYPHERTQAIADDLGCAVHVVYGKAKKLGLAKTQTYLESAEACRLRRGDNVGAAHRFTKGHVPANKGLRRPGWHAGRMRETQFQKGSQPHNTMPVGSYRINADGYLDRKMTDTGYPPRDWVSVHRLVWIQAHGPIPSNHVVAFKAGQHSTEVEKITLDALECIPRAELARRNHWKNTLPKPLQQVVVLRSAIKRQLTMRERHAQDHRRS